MKNLSIRAAAFLSLFSAAVLILAGSGHAETVSYTCKFEPPTVTAVDGYHDVSMAGTETFGKEGEPSLLVRPVKLLLPPETEVINITIRPGAKRSLAGNYLVRPGSRQVHGACPCPGEATTVLSEIYRSGSPYPAKTYSFLGIQRLNGCRLAVINLYPVEYLPAAGKLSYFSSLSIDLELVPKKWSGSSPGAVAPRFRDGEQTKRRLKSLADNQADVNGFYEHYRQASSRSQAGGGASSLTPLAYEVKYVIITSQEFMDYQGENSWYVLMEQKKKRGISSKIVSTEWIYANYDGTKPEGGEDDQTRIRNFITDAFNVWGTEYVLLGGDSDGGGGEVVVPHRLLSDPDAANEEGSMTWDNWIPADIYYACLDGTFDADADGIYGELDDGEGGDLVDLLAEVYVGRAPVDSIEEVKHFVSKTVAYENSAGEYLHQAVLVGEWLGAYIGKEQWKCDTTYGKYYLEDLHYPNPFPHIYKPGFSACPFLNVQTLYDQENGPDGWPQQAIVDLINQGVHLIAQEGHATTDKVVKLYSTDMDLLTNEDHFFAYFGGCWAGAFDNRLLGTFQEYGPDCVAEELVTGEKGAFAVVANSRYGWWSYEGTDSSSQHCAKEFWDALFMERITNLGKTLQDSKEDNLWMGIWGLYDLYELNLLGDPETPLKVRSETASVRFDRDLYPAGATARIWLTDLNLPAGTQSVTVKVKSDWSRGKAIMLHRYGNDPSLFRGYVDLTLDPPQKTTQLKVKHGDVITVEYTDPKAANGQPFLVKSTSQVDAQPPVVSDIQVTAGPTHFILQFITDELAQPIAEAYCDIDPSKIYIPMTVPQRGCLPYMGITHEVLISDLVPTYPYVLILKVRDKVGNEVNQVVPGVFTTTPNAPILVVDDDGYGADPSAFESALDKYGFDYDVWDSLAWEQHSLPEPGDLFPYDVVLWDSGIGNPFCNLRTKSATPYLKGGGRLLLAGRGIFWMPSEFMSGYLKINSVTSPDSDLYETISRANGVAGDPITSELNVALYGTPWGNCNSFATDAVAKGIFTPEEPLENPYVGSRYEDPTIYYKVVVLSFPFSKIKNPDQAALLLKKAVDWLNQ
ncbi:MAG: C25 family cysteine peptidase [PVC group bacterium]